MYVMLSDENGTECRLLKKSFKELPQSLKDLITSSATKIHDCDEGESISIIFDDDDLAFECGQRINKYYKNQYRSEYRKSSENLKSAGLYERSDLHEIRAIQKNQCYFSGKELSDAPKNWALDHLTPVRAKGSSWPGNLALVLKEVNQEKHGRSKSEYWKFLSKKYGTKWVNARKKECEKVDKERKNLHLMRKKAVKETLENLEKELEALFPKHAIELFLDDELFFYVNDLEVCYPPGFIRRRKCFKDTSYFAKVIKGLLPS